VNTTIAIPSIVAAAVTLACSLISLRILRDEREEARKPSTWEDVQRIRELLFAVDKRANLVAWLTVGSAVLTLAAALLVLAA
jgi:hypothetical protein